MDIRSMQRATQETIKKRFGRKKYLASRVIPRYPQSAEREYIRIVNAYMTQFNNTFAAYIPRIRTVLSKSQRENFKIDANEERWKTNLPDSDVKIINVLFGTDIDDIFDEILDDFNKRQGLSGLAEQSRSLSGQVKKLAEQNRKLMINEWKRVVKRTLGIDIMSDYYSGVKFQQLFDKWVVDNVGLIKTIPQETLGKMKEIIKQGYLNGATTKSMTAKIMDLNPSDFGFKSEMSLETYKKAMLEYNKAKSHAQFIARDQISKLNAQVTREQQSDAGVTEYVWRTVADSRVRSSHKQLNNKRFKYNDPPVVDEKTGRRANPGEDYQCRCVALPVFDIDEVVLPWEKLTHDTKNIIQTPQGVIFMRKERNDIMAETPKLTRVKRLDSVPLEKVEYTPEGFLIDTPILTSVGIFEYTNDDGSIRKELRLPEHVFNEQSLATYESKPVIITHEAGRVSKDNVTEEIVGTILSKGYPDGDDVRAKIVIHDIDRVKQSGMRELSLGYDLVLDETPGEWNGQHYDAIQTEIVINHLAIVREARAGEQARLNIDSNNNINSQKGTNEMAKNNKNAMNNDEMRKKVAAFEERRKRRLDEAAAEGGSDNNQDTGSEVAENIKDNNDNPTSDKPSIEERTKLIKDRRDRRDADGDSDDPEAAKAVIADQDEDIEQLIQIIEELQAASDLSADSGVENEPMTEDEGDDDDKKPMNADSVEAIASELLELVMIGNSLNLDGFELLKLKPLEIKKRIIKAIKPNTRLDGKGNHYVKTAFEIALEELNSRKDTTYQRKQMFNKDGNGNPDSLGISKSQKAREEMLSRTKNGGK